MTPTVLLVAAASGLVALAVVALVALAPSRISYAERLTIAAPPGSVYAKIASQEQLMGWSAWPAATGCTCRAEGADAAVGSRVVYLKAGKPMGGQEVVELVPGRRVVLRLTDPSPLRQTPVVAFELAPAGAGGTAVELHFTNRIPRPLNALAAVLGVPGWTRRLHRADLAGLKAACEPAG